MKRIPIDRIEVGTHRRPLRGVKELAASIEEVGLLNPITVRMDGPLRQNRYSHYHDRRKANDEAVLSTCRHHDLPRRLS